VRNQGVGIGGVGEGAPQWRHCIEQPRACSSAGKKSSCARSDSIAPYIGANRAVYRSSPV
jgi:hypothetical protein